MLLINNTQHLIENITKGHTQLIKLQFCYESGYEVFGRKRALGSKTESIGLQIRFEKKKETIISKYLISFSTSKNTWKFQN